MPQVSDSFVALEPMIRRHRRRPDSLIELLNHAQELYGYLSEDLLRHLAASLELPLSQVLGTASFYHLFRFRPPSRHSCIVCTGTACEVKGSSALITALQEQLGLPLGGSRADGWISLGSVRCLGTCSAAPVVLIDGVVAKRQTVATVLGRVEALAS